LLATVRPYVVHDDSAASTARPLATVATLPQHLCPQVLPRLTRVHGFNDRVAHALGHALCVLFLHPPWLMVQEGRAVHPIGQGLGHQFIREGGGCCGIWHCTS
jgi:hypothetical protein